MESDGVEERHSGQRDTFRAIKVVDVEKSHIAAGFEGLRQLRLVQQPVGADMALGDELELAVRDDHTKLDLHPDRQNAPRNVDDMDRYARHSLLRLAFCACSSRKIGSHPRSSPGRAFSGTCATASAA